MIRLSAPFFILLFTACATLTPDERLDVDASLITDSAEVWFYRVLIKNSSDHALTIEYVEVMPIGGSHERRAYTSAREVILPGEVEIFTVSTETGVREVSRRAETGGPNIVSTGRARTGKPTARVYVTFLDGSERTKASYKVNV